MIWMPTVNVVEEVHFGLVALFELEEDPVSPAGVKSADLLESACSRPHTGIGDVDKYDSFYLKAAALFHSLTKNHAFHNGNKRTALVTLLTTLFRNNRRLNTNVTDDEVYEFVLAVTADDYPFPENKLTADEIVVEISHWIKKNSVSIAAATTGMRTSQFIKKCKQAGAKYKQGGGSHILQRGKGVRISRSTRQLDGAVVKLYLRELGLSESLSGIHADEFQIGTSEEREQIYRFMSTLRRLAKT